MKKKAHLLIYPNPATANVTIEKGKEPIEKIEVYNIFGNKTDEIIVKSPLNSYIYNSKKITGLYLINVKTNFRFTRNL